MPFREARPPGFRLKSYKKAEVPGRWEMVAKARDLSDIAQNAKVPGAELELPGILAKSYKSRSPGEMVAKARDCGDIAQIAKVPGAELELPRDLGEIVQKAESPGENGRWWRRPGILAI